MARRAYLILALALAVAGGAAWRSHSGADAAVPAHAKTPPKVPVQVALAQQTDVPVALTALAAVQPLNFVTVRSRVDGEVQKIAFTEGQTVKEGDLLAQIDPRPYQAALDQAKAKKIQDEAQLANAQRDLDRYQQLAKESFASRQQLDGQRAMVAQLTAAIAGDAAAVESAQTQVDYTTIKAPMTGRAGFRLVDRGNLVHASDATGIVTLSQLQPISATLTLPERDFNDVADAMKAGVVAARAQSPNGRELEQGSLTVLNNQIDQATGTFKAKATFANADGALWPGQSINVRLEVETLRGVVTVPEDALQRGQDGYFAFVVKTDSTIDRRKIALTRTEDGVAVIGDGLAEGERVVTAGASRIQAGTHVEPSAAGVASSAQPGADAPKSAD